MIPTFIFEIAAYCFYYNFEFFIKNGFRFDGSFLKIRTVSDESLLNHSPKKIIFSLQSIMKA